MNLAKKIIILFMITAIVGCASKTPVQSPGPSKGNQATLFDKAERLFHKDAFDQALTAYDAYLKKYPNSQSAPVALYKTGTIYIFLGRYEKARSSFSKLITEYPENALAADAEFERLNTFYLAGDFRAVIDQAPEVLSRVRGQRQQYRIQALYGDAYARIGAPAAAATQFSSAYAAADQTTKQEMLTRLKTNASGYNEQTIRQLLPGISDPEVRGYLLYQLGILQMTAGKVHSAKTIFHQLISELPSHEQSQQAYLVLEEMGIMHEFNTSTVGCLLPLTGKYQVFGTKALRGIELALSKASMNTDTQPIKLLIRDTGSDPFLAAQAVRELADEGVMGIIGPIGTAESAAVEAQRLGIPIIIFSQKENLTHVGDCVFRNFMTPSIQVNAITDYAFNTLGISRFSILFPKDEYGSEFMNHFWDKVLDHGGQVVGAESYNPKETDFAGPIQRLVGLYHEIPDELKIDTDPEDGEEAQTPSNGRRKTDVEKPEPIVDFGAIFIPDGPENIGLLLPQLAYFDIENVYLFGTNLWHSKRLMTLAPKESQGAMFPDGFFAESTRQHIQEFTTEFQATYESTPDFIDAISFDTATLMFQQVSTPGLQSPAGLKMRLLETADFMGVTGKTSFDPSGDAIKTPFLLRVDKNQFVAIEP